MSLATVNHKQINRLKQKDSRRRLPFWFKQELPDVETRQMRDLLSQFSLNTVCQQAKCPNMVSCFKNKRITFMILGNTCSRNCRFCNVVGLENDNLVVDEEEPFRISQLVKILALGYVVITSVTRDDLPDGGSSIFAKTIKLIHNIDSEIKVEVLIPDFQAKASSLRCVLDAGPCVVAHNIETVKRLYPDLRAKANYQLSLEVLRRIKELARGVLTKSSLMLGLGERGAEVIETMRDLRFSGCDMLILGQYLAPSVQHYPVKEFISIEQFQQYKEMGLSLGFKAVLSAPHFRSSYQAEEVYYECAKL